MLNNEFRFIGTIVSDYERIGSDTFPKYQLTIEVERKKKGAPSSFKLTIYEKNYSIDVTKSLKGKQVITTGYIDTWKDRTDLIAQDIIVVGAVPIEREDVAGAPLEVIEDVGVAENDLPF